jgi:hypothetical protein
MLGSAPLGKFALGQVGSNPSVIVVAVAGTGAVGGISPTTASVPGVFGTGVAGTIVPSTLVINPHRLLANVIRRTRTLGRLVANPKI